MAIMKQAFGNEITHPNKTKRGSLNYLIKKIFENTEKPKKPSDK